MKNLRKNELTIMFDLHGVIESYPNVYKPFMESLMNSGHYVIVCSGPKKERIKEELDSLGYEVNIHFDKIVSIEDYLISTGVEFEYDEKGRPWTDDKTWWCSKGLIADYFNVDLVIDNTLEYKKCMPSGVQFLHLT